VTRLLAFRLVFAAIAAAALLAGCGPLPQSLLLPDLPPSEKGAARGPLSARHGPEGHSSARGGFLWGVSAEGPGKTSTSEQAEQADRVARTTVAEAGREGVTLNLVDAPIDAAAKAVLGDVLNVNYIIDSRVKGSVTVQTSKPVKPQAVLDIFDTVLSGQGARVVVAGDLYKIVPANEVAAAGARLRMRNGGRLGPGVTVQVVPLKYVTAPEMEQVLKTVAPQNAILRVDAARNILILAGTQAELESMLDAVDLFDVDSMRGMSFALFPVDAADPNAVAQELDTIFANDPANPSKGMVRFVPNRRLRAVLAISSRPEHLRRAGTWVERLQSMNRSVERELFSYRVRNRPPSELATLLQRVYGAEPPRGTAATTMTQVSRQTGGGGTETTEVRTLEDRLAPLGPGGAAGGAGAAVLVDPSRSAPGGLQPAGPPALGVDPVARVAGGPGGLAGPGGLVGPGGAQAAEERGTLRASVSVVPDEANRMLLITATRDEYKRIEGILDRIDTMPDQVLLEATIAEVTLNDDLRLGLRWFFEKGKSEFRLTDSVLGAIAPTFPGFSYFFNSANVQVVLNALSTVTDVNVVSSPTLTVMDGKRAVLQVGDEVPIVTQQAVAVITPGAPIVNSVQYRNTGVILAIVPRINDKGRVVLEIEQEVSEVGATTSSSINSPTIQQRRIRTTVAVKDGESLALGGLMQDRSSLARDQLPILGEIPGIGNLFKSKTDNIRRTELLIIMTPRVVRDTHQARTITDEFREKLNFSLRPQRQGPPGPGEKWDRVGR
jgi:general secretion pathway protein D